MTSKTMLMLCNAVGGYTIMSRNSCDSQRRSLFSVLNRELYIRLCVSHLVELKKYEYVQGFIVTLTILKGNRRADFMVLQF